MAVGRKRVGFVYGCCLVRAERREEKKKRPADPSNCLVFFNCPLFPKRGGGGGEGREDRKTHLSPSIPRNLARKRERKKERGRERNLVPFSWEPQDRPISQEVGSGGKNFWNPQSGGGGGRKGGNDLIVSRVGEDLGEGRMIRTGHPPPSSSSPTSKSPNCFEVSSFKWRLKETFGFVLSFGSSGFVRGPSQSSSSSSSSSSFYSSSFSSFYSSSFSSFPPPPPALHRRH